MDLVAKNKGEVLAEFSHIPSRHPPGAVLLRGDIPLAFSPGVVSPLWFSLRQSPRVCFSRGVIPCVSLRVWFPR